MLPTNLQLSSILLGHTMQSSGERPRVAQLGEELSGDVGMNRRKSGFRKPYWLWLFIGVISLAAAAAVCLAGVGHTTAVSAIGSIALILTLLVVVLYTHYTYIYSKAAAYPSVSFEMQSPDIGYFQFWIQNYSNVPVSCWCKLNPSYEGRELRFGGPDVESSFYDGGSAFDVLPYQTVHGACFDLHVFFVGKNSEVWNEIMRLKKNGFPKMYFDISFWYVAQELDFKSPEIKHRYYYDFGIDKMVLDY
jgi:hypothetical protein